MAKFSSTPLTADGRSEVYNVYNPRGRDNSTALNVSVYGTFGGGTAALEYSPDQGTTWFPLTDSLRAAVEFTQNEVILIPHITSDSNEPVSLSINLTGSTSPNLVFEVTDVK